jgi:hydrogenase maturation protein HypF
MTDLAPIAAFTRAERGVLRRMLDRGIQAPRASSMGRLFDAVAALCDLRQQCRHEGQAAMLLEWQAAGRNSERAYPFPLRQAATGADGWVLDWRPALDVLLADLRAGVDVGAVSDAFHHGLADAIVVVAERVGERRVALSGGCFQNVRLTEAAVAALHAAGFAPLWHQRIPPNDGGIALGQSAWAAWMDKGGTAPCA